MDRPLEPQPGRDSATAGRYLRVELRSTTNWPGPALNLQHEEGDLDHDFCLEPEPNNKHFDFKGGDRLTGIRPWDKSKYWEFYRYRDGNWVESVAVTSNKVLALEKRRIRVSSFDWGGSSEIVADAARRFDIRAIEPGPPTCAIGCATFVVEITPVMPCRPTAPVPFPVDSDGDLLPDRWEKEEAARVDVSSPRSVDSSFPTDVRRLDPQKAFSILDDPNPSSERGMRPDPLLDLDASSPEGGKAALHMWTRRDFAPPEGEDFGGLGDGLTAFEEYRGLYVAAGRGLAGRGVRHVRLSSWRKELFIATKNATGEAALYTTLVQALLPDFATSLARIDPYELTVLPSDDNPYGEIELVRTMDRAPDGARLWVPVTPDALQAVTLTEVVDFNRGDIEGFLRSRRGLQFPDPENLTAFHAVAVEGDELVGPDSTPYQRAVLIELRPSAEENEDEYEKKAIGLARVTDWGALWNTNFFRPNIASGWAKSIPGPGAREFARVYLEQARTSAGEFAGADRGALLALVREAVMADREAARGDPLDFDEQVKAENDAREILGLLETNNPQIVDQYRTTLGASADPLIRQAMMHEPGHILCAPHLGIREMAEFEAQRASLAPAAGPRLRSVYDGSAIRTSVLYANPRGLAYAFMFGQIDAAGLRERFPVLKKADFDLSTQSAFAESDLYSFRLHVKHTYKPSALE